MGKKFFLIFRCHRNYVLNWKTRPELCISPITQLMYLQMPHIGKVAIRSASDTSESSLSIICIIN